MEKTKRTFWLIIYRVDPPTVFKYPPGPMHNYHDVIDYIPCAVIYISATVL